MSSLSDTERAYEAKYSNDMEADFKAIMRRNKLIGLWAAKEMGIDGADADIYAKEVIEADFIKAGHEDVIEKISGDFKIKNINITDHIIRVKMTDLLIEAKAQLNS